MLYYIMYTITISIVLGGEDYAPAPRTHKQKRSHIYIYIYIYILYTHTHIHIQTCMYVLMSLYIVH